MKMYNLPKNKFSNITQIDFFFVKHLSSYRKNNRAKFGIPWIFTGAELTE